jgi:hypothetical protein
MGVNIFVPVNNIIPEVLPDAVNAIVKVANEMAKGRFDWCDKFAGPGGWLLSLEAALAFTEEEAPWWVLTMGKMTKVRNRKHWQKMLKDSGHNHVVFLKARL